MASSGLRQRFQPAALHQVTAEPWNLWGTVINRSCMDQNQLRDIESIGKCSCQSSGIKRPMQLGEEANLPHLKLVCRRDHFFPSACLFPCSPLQIPLHFFSALPLSKSWLEVSRYPRWVQCSGNQGMWGLFLVHSNRVENNQPIKFGKASDVSS